MDKPVCIGCGKEATVKNDDYPPHFCGGCSRAAHAVHEYDPRQPWETTAELLPVNDE
ncbi:MAG: hypothetical protein NVS3B1_07860 [Marmoricola sp.]